MAGSSPEIAGIDPRSGEPTVCAKPGTTNKTPVNTVIRTIKTWALDLHKSFKDILDQRLRFLILSLDEMNPLFALAHLLINTPARA
jgi:hypothetical protein